MVVKFEFRREVLGAMNETIDSLVLLNWAWGQGQGKYKWFKTKQGYCTYCNMDRHTKEWCFKLIGYPNWYKPKTRISGQSNKGHKGLRIIATVEGSNIEDDNPLDPPDTATKIWWTYCDAKFSTIRSD